MNRWEPRFDVFISYNRDDAPAVEALWLRLTREAGLRTWIDRARLQAGLPWRAEVEEALSASATGLIVWGPCGLGPIQRQERDLAYAVRDACPQFRVLYALLPSADLPQGTWANVDTWIRFDAGVEQPDAFLALVAAIKGEAPPAKLCVDLPDEPAPYRGLATFGLEHAQFFHGRTAQVAEMLERLPKHPWLASAEVVHVRKYPIRRWLRVRAFEGEEVE